jgi:hypothetical protein
MSLELWREMTAEYNGRIIKGSFKFIDGKVNVRTQHGKQDRSIGRSYARAGGEDFAPRIGARRKGLKVATVTEAPNKTDSITVDELLGMAYDAYARARSSPDALTKQNLTRVADGFLKQAKEMRRRCNSNDRFSNA